MTRALTRTNLHSSRLTRILADLGAIDAIDAGPAFAQQLGHWVDFRGAIALSAVHAPVAKPSAEPIAGPSVASVLALEQACAALRSGLEQAVSLDGVSKSGGARMAMPSPAPDASVEDARAYAPYRRYHQAHQHDHETRVSALRVKTREALMQCSPTLRQLAAIDAAFEAVLAEREAKLLATVPSLLEKRFNHLFKSHQHAFEGQQRADTPGDWMKPGGWLARFRGELRSVLLAELDLRLQPVLGLFEAFHNEKTQQA